MRAREIAVLLGGWAFWAASAAGDTVSITPSTSTVACDGSVTFTVTVDPGNHLRQITVAYPNNSGQDVSASAPFSTTHTFNTLGGGLVVTATATYSDGSPDDQASATVDVVGLTISGPATPVRGWPTCYTMQSDPSGRTLSDMNWTYFWSGGSNSMQGKAVWPGIMVISGTLTASATVSGVPVQVSRKILVTPRTWSVPISCAQDNDPDYGDPPTLSAELGCNRDQASHYGSYIFAPRNGPTDFSPARTLGQSTSGPCAGWWYVASTTLKCQRETAINRYIKPGAPPFGDKSFYEANAYCFSTSPDNFLQAIKNHEYRGTPDTPKSLGGHQGRIERAILDGGCDPNRKIESLIDRSQLGLSITVNTTISNDEAAMLSFVTDEVYMQAWGPNWGSGAGLGTGLHSLWDDQDLGWTNCVNIPDSF